MMRRGLIGLLLLGCAWTSSAGAEEQPEAVTEIDYERALRLAREKAPAMIAARARAREAEAGLRAAAVWRANPQLRGALGPRLGTGTGTSELEASLEAEQWLELGGDRGARIATARAAAAAVEAGIDDTRRQILLEVSLAFVSTLHRQRRLALAREDLAVLESITQVATRRREVGDLGSLEEAVATLALVRARTGVERARAAQARARGHLGALLGLGAEALTCQGDLRELPIPAPARTLQRPDLRVLEAEIQRAEAEAARARAERIPDLALGLGYDREEGGQIVRGTLTLALPIFDHGQGRRAVALARREQLLRERDALGGRATLEADSARAILRTLEQAARAFEDEGLRILGRAERLALASYQAGAIPLAQLLAVRVELVQARREHADLLLAVAAARTELAATTGALR